MAVSVSDSGAVQLVKRPNERNAKRRILEFIVCPVWVGGIYGLLGTV